MRGRLQASSCSMRRSGERLIPTKRSRRQPFWRRYRAWLGGGSWCAPTPPWNGCCDCAVQSERLYRTPRVEADHITQVVFEKFTFDLKKVRLEIRRNRHPKRAASIRLDKGGIKPARDQQNVIRTNTRLDLALSNNMVSTNKFIDITPEYSA
jgi:hypothetical protein